MSDGPGLQIQWLQLDDLVLRLGLPLAPPGLIGRLGPQYLDTLPPVRVVREHGKSEVVAGHLAYALALRHRRKAPVILLSRAPAEEDLQPWHDVDRALIFGLGRHKPSRPTRAKRARIEHGQTCPLCALEGRTEALRIPQAWARLLREGSGGYVSCPRCKLRLALSHDGLRAFCALQIRTRDLWTVLGGCPRCEPACANQLQILPLRPPNPQGGICACVARGRSCQPGEDR